MGRRPLTFPQCPASPNVYRSKDKLETRSDGLDAQTLRYDMNAYAEENMRLPLAVEMEFTAGAGI
jgi:hypothetical protein